MSERGFLLSPQQKRVLEPVVKFLTPAALEGVKEIVINTPQEVGKELFDGSWVFEKHSELTEEVLMDAMKILAEISGQGFDLDNPILSFRMPGGHRAQVVAGAQNARRFSMSIRVHHEEREFTIDDYLMNEEDKKEILECVRNKKTLLISGGTGSGKTSFMNVILKEVGMDERLVTIEDVRELKVQQPNVCMFTFANVTKGKGGPTVTDILNACLRMRPDRILLGEIRQENAFTFCSAINTGHAGSMATIHANDPKSALDAVINRVLLNGDVSETAMGVLRRQLQSDIYGVVQLTRIKGGVEGYYKRLKDVD